MSYERQFRVDLLLPAVWLLVMALVSPVTGNVKPAVDPVHKTTKCFECSNYDDKGTFYDQCPKNGTVVEQRAYLGNCTGKCFTHDYDRDKKVVYRGCTSNLYGLPDPLPADGCYPWYSEVWCVCSTDRCNQGMLGTPTTEDQFDAHIQKKGIGNNATGGSSSPLQPLMHSLHLVLAAIVVTITTTA